MAAKDLQVVCKKVSDLLALAQSDNEEEARSAALQAAHMVKEYELVLVPKEELERAKKHVEGVLRRAKDASQEATRNMVLAGAAGLFLGKKMF